MPFVVASDGVRLYAEAHGEGPAIVLSCALNTTHENWRPQVAPFVAAGYRVVLWDYRGHGLSDAPEDPSAYSMERVVQDLGEVLSALAPGAPAILGGLSFGGLASLHYTLAHPDRVRGLVLIDTGPGFKKPEAQARWEAQIERVASRLERDGWERFLSGNAAATAIGTRPELPEAQAAARAIAAQDAQGVAHFGRRVAGLAKSVIDDLERIDKPALVLVGELDEPYLRAADVMSAKLPRATRVTLAEAGHVCNIEQADRFNRAVLDFLGALDGA